MPHPILKLLAQRVATPGLLQSNQLGVTVHALRQVGLLTVRSHLLLDVITSLAPDTEARSLAATFHALALSTREQCEPSVAISPELHRSLLCLQDSLAEVTHDLTASDNILVTEALLELFAFGSGVLRLKLLHELLERTLGLVYAVERPIDFLGILRVIKRLHQGHPFSLVLDNWKNTEVDSCTDLSVAVPTGDEETELLMKRIHQWSEEAMTQALSAIQVRLNTWGRHDIISLLDVFTVRGARPPLRSSLEGYDPNTHSRQPTQHLLEAALPLLPTLIDTAMKGLDEMLPSHGVAWILRLANLQLYSNALPLFIGIVRRLSDTQTQKKMSLSQLGSLLIALNRILSEVSETAEGADVSSSTPAAHLSLTSSSRSVKANDSAFLSTEDRDACLSLFVSVFMEVVFRINQMERGGPNAEQAVKTELLPLLPRLPEEFLTRFGLPRKEGSPHSSSNTSIVEVLKSFCTTLEKACSLLLRHFASLVPRDQVDVVVTTLHWNVFYASSSSLHVSEDATPLRHFNTNSLTTSIDIRSVFSGRNTARHTGADLVWIFPPLSHEAAARKLKALCGLIRENISQYNAMDMIKILNEAVTSTQVSSGSSFRNVGRAAQLPLTARGPDVFEDVYSVCVVLREVLKESRLRDEIAALPSFILVRYLTTLSKLKVRTKSEYMEVLNFLTGRDLTPFELICVLGVMGRHHLNAPYFLSICVRRLSELSGVLEPMQKAFLLKYIGQSNGQRFVRSPVFGALNGGAFFRSESEVNKLTYLEAVFSFNGLMELRQYENQTLRWLLDGPLTSGLDSNENPGGASQQLIPNTIAHVRSSTTLAEFLISLCRLGGPSQHVPFSLVIAAMQALQHAVVSSRSLFVDLALLLSYWPILSRYTALLACDASIHDHPLVSVKVQADAPPSRSIFSERSSQIDKVSAAWHGLVETTAPLVRARLLDISRSSQLRLNTFLFHQMAIGCCLGAMPPADSDEERTLVRHMDIKNMNELMHNPRRLIDGVILGLYLIPRYPTEALCISEFVLKHVGALRVQDALSVWCLLEDAFRTNSYIQSIVSNPDLAATTSVTSLFQIRDTLHGLREVTKMHVMEERNTQKLSPMESRLTRELL
ncbi:unnamed protein product [Phytomonas sp. EM1]|nr:unnamed protein product [Phytomonas sp. EM1]|eukprot:CCW60376.1 unnamed protein product [Phytomonas sp. isolate EM1]